MELRLPFKLGNAGLGLFALTLLIVEPDEQLDFIHGMLGLIAGRLDALTELITHDCDRLFRFLTHRLNFSLSLSPMAAIASLSRPSEAAGASLVRSSEAAGASLVRSSEAFNSIRIRVNYSLCAACVALIEPSSGAIRS